MVSIEDASTGMDCVTYGRLAPRCEFGWFPCLAFTVNYTPKRATLARGTYWNPTRASSYFCQSAWRRRKFAGKRDPNQTSRLERSKIRCSAIDWSDLFHQETVVYEESTPLCVVQVPTSPIPGQKTGTSGIRKRTREVTQTPNFFENWFQSLFDVLVERYGRTCLNRATLVVGGDGREGNQAALRTHRCRQQPAAADRARTGRYRYDARYQCGDSSCWCPGRDRPDGEPQPRRC
jgi:hypothetical protein